MRKIGKVFKEFEAVIMSDYKWMAIIFRKRNELFGSAVIKKRIIKAIQELQTIIILKCNRRGLLKLFMTGSQRGLVRLYREWN